MKTKIEGVTLTNLLPHKDDRGVFTESFRLSWGLNIKPKQWNIVHSEKNVLRGVHVHIKHSDYLLVVSGSVLFNLKDLRKKSPTFMQNQAITISADKPQGLLIPQGVAHGFYMPQKTTTVYSVSEYWDKADELGCYYNDPDLKMGWPTAKPKLSDRDKNLGSLQELLSKYSF